MDLERWGKYRKISNHIIKSKKISYSYPYN